MSVKLKAHGVSDVGLVRTNNEDSWFSSPQEAIFLLADGLGGHQSGEIASKEAVDFFLKSYRQEIQRHPTFDNSIFQKILIATNQFLYDLSCSHELLKGMGTTFLALHLQEGRAFVCHVGDSRLYRLRKGKKLEQITHDHLTNHQKNNAYPQANAGVHKGYLTKALGTQREIEPDLPSYEVQGGDIYLLCSDGLSDMLSDEQIEKVLQTTLTIEQKVRMLVSLAKEEGGMDNITVVMVEVSSELM